MCYLVCCCNYVGDNVIHNTQRYTNQQSYRESLTPDSQVLYDLERLDSERYYDDIRPSAVVYVTIYARVLRYGGSEEGGWWYDNWYIAPDAPQFRTHNCRDSVEHDDMLASEWCENVNATLAPYHSVNGGVEYIPIIELSRGTHVAVARQWFDGFESER